MEEVRDEDVRADAVRSLIDVTPDEWCDGLKDLIGRFKDARHRAVLLAEVASRLSMLETAMTREEALASVAQMPDRLGRAEALREMAARVPEPDAKLLESALRAVVALHRPMYAADAIEHLAPHLDERLAAEAVDYARSLDDELLRVRVMASVVDKLGPRAIEQLLTEVKRLRRQVQRRELLCALAPCISDQLWASAIDMAMAVLDESYQPDALITFFQYMPETMRPLAIAATDRIIGPEAKLKALWGIEQMIGPAPIDETQPGESASEPEPPASIPSTDLIQLFAPLLSGSGMPHTPADAATGHHTQALARLRRMTSELDRVAAISDLAGQLDDYEVVEILQIVEGLSEANRAAVLQTLARHAAPTVVPRLWHSLRGITDTQLYASVLLPIAMRLSTLAAPQAHEICADVIRVLAGGKRSVLLDGIRTLVPAITALGHEREIVDTAVSINEVGTWWP